MKVERSYCSGSYAQKNKRWQWKWSDLESETHYDMEAYLNITVTSILYFITLSSFSETLLKFLAPAAIENDKYW